MILLNKNKSSFQSVYHTLLYNQIPLLLNAFKCLSILISYRDFLVHSLSRAHFLKSRPFICRPNQAERVASPVGVGPDVAVHMVPVHPAHLQLFLKTFLVAQLVGRGRQDLYPRQGLDTALLIDSLGLFDGRKHLRRNFDTCSLGLRVGRSFRDRYGVSDSLAYAFEVSFNLVRVQSFHRTQRGKC